MRGVLFVLIALAAAPALADDEAPPIRPGLWEFSIAGMPSKQNVCLKPDMVKDIQSLSQRGNAGSDCKTSDMSKSGGTTKYKVSCTKPQKYEATVTTTVTSPDNFSIQQDYSTESGGRAQKGSLKVNYKRLRDC